MAERKFTLDDQDRQTDARRHTGSPIEARLCEVLQITFFSAVVSQELKLLAEGRKSDQGRPVQDMACGGAPIQYRQYPVYLEHRRQIWKEVFYALSRLWGTIKPVLSACINAIIV